MIYKQYINPIKILYFLGMLSLYGSSNTSDTLSLTEHTNGLVTFNGPLSGNVRGVLTPHSLILKMEACCHQLSNINIFNAQSTLEQEKIFNIIFTKKDPLIKKIEIVICKLFSMKNFFVKFLIIPLIQMIYFSIINIMDQNNINYPLQTIQNKHIINIIMNMGSKYDGTLSLFQNLLINYGSLNFVKDFKNMELYLANDLLRKEYEKNYSKVYDELSNNNTTGITSAGQNMLDMPFTMAITGTYGDIFLFFVNKCGDMWFSEELYFSSKNFFYNNIIYICYLVCYGVKYATLGVFSLNNMRGMMYIFMEDLLPFLIMNFMWYRTYKAKKHLLKLKITAFKELGMVYVNEQLFLPPHSRDTAHIILSQCL